MVHKSELINSKGNTHSFRDVCNSSFNFKFILIKNLTGAAAL